MNGPLKTYRTKQIVHHDFGVPLPDCMYRMRNIHAPRSDTAGRRASDHASPSPKSADILDKDNRNLPGMAALQARQEEILRQLADLKRQMDSIRNSLNVPKPAPIPAIITRPPPTLPDITINASPTNPPYSLEFMQTLWKDYLCFSVQTYRHSSLRSLNENAQQLSRALEGFAAEGSVPRVNVRLIWKDVGANAELIISQRPIVGEVNILRYLSRASSDILNYETYDNAHEIDSLLDASHSLIKSKTKTERCGLLQALNKSLGKSRWLAGRSEISIADLAAYSAIKQATGEGEVNVNLGKWMERVVLLK